MRFNMEASIEIHDLRNRLSNGKIANLNTSNIRNIGVFKQHDLVHQTERCSQITSVEIYREGRLNFIAVF